MTTECPEMKWVVSWNCTVIPVSNRIVSRETSSVSSFSFGITAAFFNFKIEIAAKLDKIAECCCFQSVFFFFAERPK